LSRQTQAGVVELFSGLPLSSAEAGSLTLFFNLEDALAGVQWAKERKGLALSRCRVKGGRVQVAETITL